MESQSNRTPLHKSNIEHGATKIAREGTIGDYFLLAGRDSPEQPLVSDETLSLTYGDGCRLAKQLAASFVAWGFHRGDRALICMPNNALFPILCNAIWMAGGVIVVASPLDPESVLAFKFSDCSPRLVFALDDSALLARIESANVGSAELTTVNADEPLGIMDVWAPVAESHNLPTVSPSDLAILQYTGGTTGTPKAAMLSHANITASVEQSHLALGLVYGEERFFAAAPFSHITGLSILVLACSVAAEMIIVNRFDPAAAVKLITKRQLTYVIGVPTMFNAMLRTDMGDRDSWAGCRYFISGGAPIPEELASQFYLATGHKLLAAYGLSETSPGVSLAPLDAPQPVGSSGTALHETQIEIRSLIDPSVEMELGESGEICVRGPQVMQGYWGRPAETQNAFVNGWLRTGDIGRMDGDGYLYVVDRLKDIIIASGYNVYPAQVEEAIYFHPDVLEVAVVGEPDAYRGETVKAVIVLKPGAVLDLVALQTFLKDRLSPIEMPKLLTIVDDLPKSPAGKILRRALRDESK